MRVPARMCALMCKRKSKEKIANTEMKDKAKAFSLLRKRLYLSCQTQERLPAVNQEEIGKF